MIRRVARSVRRAVGWPAPPDYRALLFEELRAYLGDRRPSRVLEIGPKDGFDTRRRLTLEPQRRTLVAALIGTMPITPRSTVYYALGQEEGYEIGRAL